jgi:hypothetical protein
MEWTFGTLLWSTAVLFFWFAVVWMFISVFIDIFQRDMSGWAKAGWIVLIVLLPFLGVLIYLIALPRRAKPTGAVAASGARHGTAADEIATAARLHDEGKITADEFERLKQQALSY